MTQGRYRIESIVHLRELFRLKTNSKIYEVVSKCLADCSQFSQHLSLAPTPNNESGDSDVDECHLGGESQNAIDVMENLAIPGSLSPLTPVPELEAVQDCEDMKPPAYSSPKQTPPRSKRNSMSPADDDSSAQKMAKRWQEGSIDFRSVETQYTSSPDTKVEIPPVAVVQQPLKNPSLQAAKAESPVNQRDNNQKRNFTLVGKTNREVKRKGTEGLRFCAKDLPPSSR